MPQASCCRVSSLLCNNLILSVACGVAIVFGVASSTEAAPPRKSAPRHHRSTSESAGANVDRQLARAAALVQEGQETQAEQIYRDILHRNAHDERAYAALLALIGDRELSARSNAADSADQRLPQQFAVHQTARFVLFSDVSEYLTLQNARWVERAHEEFERFAQECGLRPLPLQHKLVCILFEHRHEYLHFAQMQDGLSNVAFSGYYSPRHDRVVFSVEPDQSHSNVRRRDNQPGDDLGFAEPKPVLGFSAEDPAQPAEHDQHAECGHEHELPNASAAKCVHETIHQLMFHTRVMAPDVQYPLWICEGLSTAFETDTPSQAFGPDRDFAPRRKAFEALLRRDTGGRGAELLPLRELVTITQLSSSHQRQIHTVYQQSYALVTWMCRERKEQLRNYLHVMRTQPAGRIPAARQLQLFEEVFGDVDEVEQAWLEYEQSNRRTAAARW